ncbi:MAG TPA: hypothetical protein VMH50_14665 [Thermoleophilia bacterium]|nr:hypothetical protein [Thermoleophilia bacterium]
MSTPLQPPVHRRSPHPPVGVRLLCEACAEESLVALPVFRSRYQVVDCPCCRSTYLVQLDREDLSPQT